MTVTVEQAVTEAVEHAGLHTTSAVCVHTPARAGCPPCAEVALLLALDAVREVRTDFAV